jgi:hypothetical protein
MTGRERILAALRKQPVDRIPWVPLIVPYTIAGFPDDAPHVIPEFMEYIGCDCFARHGRVVNVIPFPKPFSRIKYSLEYKDGDRILRIQTARGTLESRERCMGDGRIPVYIKHLVSTVEDLKVFLFYLENTILMVRKDLRLYERERSAIGDRGILSVNVEFTPIQSFLEQLSGLENTYLLMTEAPEIFDRVTDLMHTRNMYKIKKMAESPAEVYIHYENTSSTMMSPRIFRKYCLPQLNEISDLLHDHGKLHLIHMCGKLSAFRDVFQQCRFDGMTDVAPSPTGDLELWEALELYPGKVITGGIDATTFAMSSPATCYERTVEIITKIKASPGALLGSGDSTPCGTSLENFKAIRRALDDVGMV